MAMSLDALRKRIERLENSDQAKDVMIRDLERANEKLKKSNKNLQKQVATMKKLEDLRQSCVFSVRMKALSNAILGTPEPAWKPINQHELTYRDSEHFNTRDCVFTAPDKGDYFMDMGIRQENSGGLEVMIHIKPANNVDVKHAYVGRTNGQGEVCHKSMMVQLSAGDKVFGVMRRTSGSCADIQWCAFNGYLITADVSDNDQEHR